MGTTTPSVPVIYQARKMATLDDAMRHYGITLTTNTRENVYHGHCPLPTHRRPGGQSFRIKANPLTGKMIGWECLSISCANARRSKGNDVVAFVAAMEGCDLDRAAYLIIGGLLAKK